MSTSQSTDIANPAAKAGVAAAAVVAGLSWGDIASILAAAYTALLIGEWVWKKVLRPFAERRGWKQRPEYRRRQSDVAVRAVAAGLLGVMLLTAPADNARADTVFAGNVVGIDIVLTDVPCALESVPEEFRSVYFAGGASLGGQSVQLCYSVTQAPGAVCIVDQYGQHVDIPAALFGAESI